MINNPNKLSQFWQELKRRKVVRVITVYAAAAFVILELVDIVTEPFGLPDWTLKLVVVLLSVGLIVSIILSWIYDVQPEGGIVKTEPAHKVKGEDRTVASNSWRIASYISFVVIVGLIVLNIIPRSSNKKILEKSIAVLPLDYLSEDPNKQYLANGVLDAITGHLSMIEGLRVMPRTSVEQYRENKKSAKEIGEELDVSFLIEGSFLMIEDQVKLTILLVVAEEGDHVFFKEYDRNYEDIFAVQSEVAQTIAKEIEVAISPEEMKRIEKIPTTSLTALDFYQRAQEEFRNYNLSVYAGKKNTNGYSGEKMERAEDLYNKALDNDSAFAQAYIGLGQVYMRKHFWESYFSENYLDSVLILANLALSFDSQLSEAYTVRGDYYWAKGLTEQAIDEYDRALNYNPNDWQAYRGKGRLYWSDDDHIKSIDNYQKAASLNHGSEFPDLLRDIGQTFLTAGFIENGNNYIVEAFKLDGDSAEYYFNLARGYSLIGEYRQSNEYLREGYAIDSNHIGILLYLGWNYFFQGQYEESFRYFEKYVERLKELGSYDLMNMSEIGYVYWQMGYKQEAEFYFDKQIEYGEEMIKLNRPRIPYLDLAGVYAFRGDRDKAYENLRLFNQSQRMMSWAPMQIKNDPLFDSIRDEPEFQQIVHDVEAKYQAEHERVRKWLEENDML